ncbi:MAG TPA: threonine/serine dehydratase [Candidatus Limnocylindrales bacterium]|nr:threonine/serine dehydratase [Candidatus Limnocylindrales bacterium]
MTAGRALPELVTIADIRAAAAVLRGITVHTPLVPFGRPDRNHWLKAESLQPIGAFKLRGAYVAAAALTPEERSRGLITYSSGNHAQGVARAARLFGVPAVIVMPSDAPALKRARVEADGAEIVIVGTASEERRRVAEQLAEARGLAIIPPYDDPRIVAGQGTAGLEIAEDRPDVAAVLVPIGGGGLAAGVATAIRALVPGARLIGVEPELAADAQESLAAGRVVEWPAERVSRTIADGTRTQSIGRLNFAHLSTQLDAVVTVSEAEIAAAVRLAAEEARLVVEPSGALTVAVMRFRAREAGLVGLDGPIVGVVSGGNVDPDRFQAYLEAPVPPEG